MNVAFRADASIDIGTGHIMRCLTLADALAVKGFNCLFITRAHEGNPSTFIRERGHKVALLPAEPPPRIDSDASDPTNYSEWLGSPVTSDAMATLSILRCHPTDWLVIDHYALDETWERIVSPACKHIMVIDDLANRKHDCEILLDQNLGRSAADYEKLIPSKTTLFVGTAYALLRPEFRRAREESLARRRTPRLKQLLVMMGGIDKNNVTTDVLNCLAPLPILSTLRVVIVMGRQAPWSNVVREAVTKLSCDSDVRVGLTDLAPALTETDLAIGAAGSSAWERCCLGVPSIQLVLAENQKSAALALERASAAISIRDLSTLPYALPALLHRFLSCPEALRPLSDSAAKVCDGTGCDLIVDHLTSAIGP